MLRYTYIACLVNFYSRKFLKIPERVIDIIQDISPVDGKACCDVLELQVFRPLSFMERICYGKAIGPSNPISGL
jgi:hypothetical protein